LIRTIDRCGGDERSHGRRPSAALPLRRDNARPQAWLPVRRGSLSGRALALRARFWSPPRVLAGAPMIPFFVQIKCQLGKSYDVANRLADAEIASEIYSTAGEFDLLVKFYVDDGTDIGHFINEKVQTIPGIQDTRTIITFKAF
jgi:DNA-binding Lrp family transcriptional regulator